MSTRIELILASAGSGKTTRLAAELEHALESGAVRPEAVVATTFTRQAASELAERARTRLLSVGRHDDAHRLQAARIGTVNAVCGRLVEQFAFELGLSPDVRVIDDAASSRALREAMSEVIGATDRARIGDLGSRCCDLELPSSVARVVASARANGMSASDLQDSARRSLALSAEVLGPRDDDGEAIDRALVEAMEALVAAISVPNKVGAIGARDRCRRNLGAMAQGRRLEWREWASLSTLNATKDYRSIAGQVQAAAAAHERHPQFHADVTGAIELVFSLATRTLTAYEESKKRAGVIDFVDQEAYALQLLRLPEVTDRLREEIDLVMVDEFQDTSPLQLAIFLKLAEIAPRSVWVGDQKQSIYGFRGTDPELMNAALLLLERRDPAFVDETLAALFEQTTPQTLSKSWRSRPALVELTSELFARAFALHDMPPDRVRLSPGHAEEPEGLGPIIEVWDLQLQNRSHKKLYPVALGVGIDAFVDEGIQVRDRPSGEARPLRLSDVAVLSRRRVTGQRVAEALEGFGRRVVLPRPGLLDTPEGRLALAALRYFTDPYDALAAAEIRRIAEFGEDAQGWLEAMLQRRRPEGEDDAQLEDDADEGPLLPAIDRLRDALDHADPVTTLARCIDAVGLRQRCRQWGEARQRLGNLDALCSHAQAYVEGRASELRTASVPGLLAYLEGLAKDAGDEQAVLAGDEAVTLSTWHAAKGLEWPVTILFDLEWDRPPDIAGVQVEPGRERFDLRDPLADRWIRYLPQPFKANQRKVPFIERAGQLEFAQRARQRHEREQLRLLYVAWTRARDRLILAGPPGKMFEAILASLRDEKSTLLDRPDGEKGQWAGYTFDVAIREFWPDDPRPRSTEPGHAYRQREPIEHPPAFVSPSSVDAPGVAGEVFELGPSLELHGLEPQALGDGVHAVWAADDREQAPVDREALARAILERFGVADPGLAEHLVAAIDALDRFVRERWPGATVHRELPVWHPTAGGTIVRGTADLVVEHGHSYGVIDHKAMLGTLDRALRDAPGYAGQLCAYAEAITAATGQPVESTWVHLPLAGRLVQVRAATR